MKKVAIYYDSLVSKGGAERVVIELSNMLGADIITSGYDNKINEWMPIKNKVVDVGNTSIKFIKPIGSLFESPIRYYLARNKYKYDINIFFGSSSIFASNKKNVNIWYCFTPNRILYDLRNVRLNDASYIKRLLFRLHIKLFYNLDQKIVKLNFRKIISESTNVQKRVKKYYGLDSSIIYPPVKTHTFSFKDFGDYYLTVSRLYEDKRVSLIAKAFCRMHKSKLVIVGDGPEKGVIQKLIEKYENITLMTDVSDEKLQQLYASCLATVYMPVNEDFGLIPLEGMVFGKPCIAVNEGGCRETVVNRKTGFLIRPTEKNIIEAVNKLSINKARTMKKDCLIWVRKFDTKNCLKNWKKELRNLVVI